MSGTRRENACRAIPQQAFGSWAGHIQQWRILMKPTRSLAEINHLLLMVA
jgi:hypothetical protein